MKKYSNKFIKNIILNWRIVMSLLVRRDCEITYGRASSIKVS